MTILGNIHYLATVVRERTLYMTPFQIKDYNVQYAWKTLQ